MPDAMNRPGFPFSAVVGQATLKTALLLTSIDPNLGGLLISGTRGSAKSTLARSLADFLPEHGRLITLPLGAAEEQLIGSLDLQSALKDKHVTFNPGILHKAHQGILYIDEVNLLADHLVDILLDAAASGVNYIERDGISHQHAAQFMLIGTMNPDEGIIRPQLLDRFGLSVDIQTHLTASERLQVMERRLAFEQDPIQFCADYAPQQTALKHRIVSARHQLAHIAISTELKLTIAQACIDAQVEGLRADITWLRAAMAHAALTQNASVSASDIEAVRPLVLKHRQTSPQPPDSAPPPQSPPPAKPQHVKAANPQGDWGQMPSEQVKAGPIKRLAMPANAPAREKATTTQTAFVRTGQQQISQRQGAHPGPLTAINWFKTFASSKHTPHLQPIFKHHRPHQTRLHLILLDTSGSTMAHHALAKAKGLVAGISEQAYLAREHCAVMVFGNQTCDWLIKPQRAPQDCRPLLNLTPAGGGTPLRTALIQAQQWIQRFTRQCPTQHLHTWLFTDGRVSDGLQDLHWTTPTTLVDMETHAVPLGRSQRLAAQLKAEYVVAP